MDRARTFIHTHLLKDVEDKSLFYDAKTILQEMVQAGPDPRLELSLIHIWKQSREWKARCKRSSRRVGKSALHETKA